MFEKRKKKQVLGDNKRRQMVTEKGKEGQVGKECRKKKMQ